MAADAGLTESDVRILGLFESPGPLDTPNPGTRAWLANDPSNGRKAVLIKRLGAGNQGKGRATEALALDHPNIVRTRRWLSDGGSLYVVRDVVRGKNLRQTMASLGTPRLNPEVMRRYFIPVLDALAYAHGRNVVHGGISPENVLVTADENAVVLSDFASVDPRASHHFQTYGGVASVAGDVKATGRLIATYLPTSGAFASIVVRGRIEGLIARCDTLNDLRDMLGALEKLASAPSGRMAAPTADDLKPFDDGKATKPIEVKPVAGQPRLSAAPLLTTQLADRTPRIVPGGGGSVGLTIRNDGAAPLIVRMVATQHAWLNVRPVELPLTIAPGGAERIEFFISAARLTPGEYRSEVYLSANAGGQSAEDLRGGWFKHTSEVRVTVGGIIGSGPKAPPYPSDSPVLPAVPGCAGVAFLLTFFLPLAILLLESGEHSAFAACLPVK